MGRVGSCLTVKSIATVTFSGDRHAESSWLSLLLSSCVVIASRTWRD